MMTGELRPPVTFPVLLPSPGTQIKSIFDVSPAAASTSSPICYECALRPEDKRWPDWVKGQTKKIEGVLAQLEASSAIYSLERGVPIAMPYLGRFVLAFALDRHQLNVDGTCSTLRKAHCSKRDPTPGSPAGWNGPTFFGSS
jgi:hypothetical protein